jgi:flagellar hook protein FlgE
MMRALFAGVSGLRNNQVRMDVIGNNIANVNTVAFKAGRVTFKEALAMTLQNATAPTDLQGGRNPVQVGLGVAVSSVDTLFTQGNLETTGQKTDLAIDGEGFFVLSDGTSRYFTRAGNFTIDGDGRLVSANGLKLLGKMADANGNITTGSIIQDLVLPFGQRIPARATTSITLTGNLDASKAPLGTIIDSRNLYAIEEAGDDSDINGLFARGQSNSKISGMVGGVTTVTVSDGTTTQSYTYVDEDTANSDGFFNSLDDLVQEINADFTGSFKAEIDSSGRLVMTDLSGKAHTLTFTSSHPALQAALSAANGVVDSGAGLTTKTDEFSHVATGSEPLTKLRNPVGEALGLSAGDTITISGKVGGVTKNGTFSVTSSSTLDDLAASIRSILELTNNVGVEIDSDGSIKINGDPGEDKEVTAVVIRETGNDVFNVAMTFVETQKAADVVHPVNVTVFDELGQRHVVTITFRKSEIEREWLWEASFSGDETVISGQSGKVHFNADGSLNSLTYDNGLSALTFDPGNGAPAVSLTLDAGVIGGFDGLTQFSSASTAVVSDQDGYANGVLSDIQIDSTGKITGIFTNGVTRDLAQVILATFNNPGGLVKVGDNVYQASVNSGDVIFGTAGETIASNIVPGSLEMSNVDLSQEFTNMIVAQRGFQANARVITTGDEMLNELVNLKR